MSITQQQLIDNWENAQDQADRAEQAVYDLTEKLDSLEYVLLQICAGKDLLAATAEPAALHELIANLGEDELAALLLNLPTTKGAAL